MAKHRLCDMCNRIIPDKDASYSSLNYVLLKFEIKNRYQGGSDNPHTRSLDICEGCDLKLANALLLILPAIAYYIEPNAAIIKVDDNEG